jgi:hypothetical protein
MAKGNENGGKSPKKLIVSVTSLDGDLKHPFDADDTVGQVHEFAYGRLVQQKNQFPIERTWIEFDRQKIESSRRLGSLAERSPGGGPDADLTLSLTWDMSGG